MVDGDIAQRAETQRATFEGAVACFGLLCGGRIIFHLASHFPALHGVQSWIFAHPTPVGGRLWALPWMAYGLLGAIALVSAPKRWRDAPYFVASGVVTLLYAAVHATQLLALAPGPHTSTRATYEILWVHASEWPWLPMHVLGICAVSLHVALGLPRALSVLFRTRAEWIRQLSGVLGILVLLAQLQLLSYFVIGEALWPDSSDSLSDRNAVGEGPPEEFLAAHDPG